MAGNKKILRRVQPKMNNQLECIIRDKEVKNRWSADLMRFFEMMTMGLNAGASLILVFISIINQKVILSCNERLLHIYVLIKGKLK